MSIIWCGGEDLDFTGGNISSGIYCRSNYARQGIYASAGASPARSAVPFSPVTSCWLSFQTYGGAGTTEFMAGLVLSSAGYKGLWLGGHTSTSNKLALYKYDGTTKTLLANESGVSLNTGAYQQICMQVVNFGASSTVNVYLNGTLSFSYTGDVTVSGVANLDAVGLGNYGLTSEIIVADEDTRLMSLCTLAPNAAGDANAWTGAYTDISESTINDATEIYTNTVSQDAQVNVSGLPTGTFTIKAVKIAARAAKSAGATAGSICFGVKSGGTIDPGSSQACTTAWETKERLMPQNPVTSNLWQPSEISALQLNFRSAS